MERHRHRQRGSQEMVRVSTWGAREEGGQAWYHQGILRFQATLWTYRRVLQDSTDGLQTTFGLCQLALLKPFHFLKARPPGCLPSHEPVPLSPGNHTPGLQARAFPTQPQSLIPPRPPRTSPARSPAPSNPYLLSASDSELPEERTQA